jgi:hypothetical protein
MPKLRWIEPKTDRGEETRSVIALSTAKTSVSVLRCAKGLLWAESMYRLLDMNGNRCCTPAVR